MKITATEKMYIFIVIFEEITGTTLDIQSKPPQEFAVFMARYGLLLKYAISVTEILMNKKLTEMQNHVETSTG